MIQVVEDGYVIGTLELVRHEKGEPVYRVVPVVRPIEDRQLLAS